MANNGHAGTGSPQQILVVDDDPSMRLLCTATLKKAGFLVLEAEGSTEAMVHYTKTKTPIDLLVTDLFLPPPSFQLSSGRNQYPRVNGHHLVDQVLALKKEARVLFMSSHGLGSLATQGITIAPERFLAKPFTAEQLLHRVATVLAGDPIQMAPPAVAASSNDVQWRD
jgi:two-component system, cell cycle sensor histidine kinase and response regulator CckA